MYIRLFHENIFLETQDEQSGVLVHGSIENAFFPYMFPYNLTPPPHHWNYNGEIRQKRDLVIAFDWEVLLTWSTHLNCILQDFFRDTPLDHIWRAQIRAQRIKGRQICFEWLNHGRNYFFLVRKLWYLKECLNGGGGVSQLSLFDNKSEKRSKRRSKNSRYGVPQLPLFDVK